MNFSPLTKLLVLIILIITSCQENYSQNEIISSIDTLMTDQQVAWNRGDLEAFMEGYWKSDSLEFIGSRGINKGWQNTLDGYKKGYPNQEAMGELRFEILEYNTISADACLVTGKFFLTRTIGDLSGIFTLMLRKIDGKWLIVYDHTC